MSTLVGKSIIETEKSQENDNIGALKELLIIIVDTNPSLKLLKEKKFKLSKCIDAIMAFGNSHLMMDVNNKLAVIGCNLLESRFLYPNTSNIIQNQTDGPRDSRYELFSRVNTSIHSQVKDLILNANLKVVHTESLIAGAMAMALCYVNRIKKDMINPENLKSRILVVTSAGDSVSQYMNFMNIFFSAQKLNVTVNACMLDKDSSLLQQGADITSGRYLKIPNIDGLLQYLLWEFLPSKSIENQLVLPPPVHVDYRAACFCHRTLIEIGYVCSVCLSIFCTFSPICSTCQTTFKIIGTRPNAKNKKRKIKPNT